MPSSPVSLQSISGSDWLNTVAAGDITGELVAAVLPDLAVNPLNVKRSLDRRFVRDRLLLGGPARHTGLAGGPQSCWSLSAEEQQGVCPPCPDPSHPQPVYKADLLPCSPDGPQGTEQALPRTHCYSEMVARSYIRFQDTDLVGERTGASQGLTRERGCGWAVGVLAGPGDAAGALGQG